MKRKRSRSPALVWTKVGAKNGFPDVAFWIQTQPLWGLRTIRGDRGGDGIKRVAKRARAYVGSD
jgi:hypothetical protein